MVVCAGVSQVQEEARSCVCYICRLFLAPWDEEVGWMAVLCGPWSRLLAANWTTSTSRWACGKAGLKSFIFQPSTTKPETPLVRLKDSKSKGYAFFFLKYVSKYWLAEGVTEKFSKN